MISIEEYKANPCRVSSIPSWKMNAIKTPRTIAVVNHEEFMANPGFFLEDTLYFRFKHDLGNVEPANLPEGFAYSMSILTVAAIWKQTRPEQLYRRCGFSGNDIWHVLLKG